MKSKRTTYTKCICSIVFLLCIGIIGLSVLWVDVRKLPFTDLGALEEYHTILSPVTAKQLEEWRKNYWTNPISDEYESYANESGTYLLQPNIQNDYCEAINHIGTVLDIETNSPIPNATLIINSETSIKTDNHGRFQILDFPAGKYNFRISADGYEDSHYLNVKIDNVGSTVISIMYMSKVNEFIEDHAG